MQRYEGFSGVDDDCGVSVAIGRDCSVFVVEGGSLGSPEPVANGLDFAGCEGFFGDFCRWPDVRQRGLALTKMKIICKVCEKFVSLQFGIIQRNEP